MTDASKSAKAEKLKSRQEDGGLVLRLDEVRPNRQVAAPQRMPQLPAKPVRKTTVTYKSEKMTGFVTKAKGGFSGAKLAFFLMVVVPTVIGGLYYAALASPRYVSEFRFSVRPGEGGTGSSAADMALTMSNSYIVSDYAMSRDAVESLEKDVGLREMYSRPEVDFLSRLPSDVSLEGLVRYWNKRLSTSYDLTTGINTIEVAAFNPQDAFRISTALQALCEKLVNDLSEKARQSQLSFAKAELDRSEKRLTDVRSKETALRTGQKSIDARKEADGKIQLISKLNGSLADLQAQYTALGSYMDPKSPRLQVVKSQINATQKELDRLQSQIRSTTGEEAGPEKISDAQLMSQYDTIQSDLDIATKLYTSSLTNYENARMMASNNQIYLATYVQPGVAQIASYPKVFLDTFLVFLAACGVWVVLTLVYYSVRDHA
jgi:capsular polysaccharide transport system permease protein